jgi:cytochrome b subunit of formate dehydrogenase
MVIALMGLWRAAHRPVGYQSGPASRWLRFPFYLVATLLILLIGYLLWRPLPLELPSWSRLALDLFSALIFFPALALYVWGRCLLDPAGSVFAWLRTRA